MLGIAPSSMILEITSNNLALTASSEIYALVVVQFVQKLFYVTRKDENSMKEKMKEEAISRMNILKLHPNVIKEFSNSGKVNLSLNAALYYLNDEQLARVQEFEQKYNALVYLVIQNHTQFGELLSFLYVSQYTEEWEYDRSDLKECYPLVYVANLTDEICSEFGHIEIRPCVGGVIRTY